MTQIKGLKKSVEIMSGSSKLLKHHVDDILDYSTLKAGKFRKVDENFEISKATKEVVEI